MNNSKWWKDMYVTNEKYATLNEDEMIISKAEPVTFESDSKANIIVNTLIKTSKPLSEYSLAHKEEIIKFINRHNCHNTFGNIETMDSELMGQFEGMNAIVTILRYSKTNRIMGVIFSVSLTLTSGKISNDHGYTTYMTVHKKLRDKGVAMMLIRGNIEYGYKNMKVYCGYHLVDHPHTKTSITIESWFRPINLTSARKVGFDFKSYREPKDKSDFRNKFKYRIPSLKPHQHVKKITADTARIVYPTFQEIQKKKILFWDPSIEEFCRFIENFDMYYVQNLNNIVAFFALRKSEPFIVSSSSKANLGLMVLFTANKNFEKLGFEGVLNVAEKCGHDVLYGYEMGDLELNTVKECNGGATSSHLYLEFYNNKLSLESKDLMIPLL